MAAEMSPIRAPGTAAAIPAASAFSAVSMSSRSASSAWPTVKLTPASPVQPSGFTSAIPRLSSPWSPHAVTPPSRQLLLRPAAEVAGEEPFGRRVEAQPVLGLGEPVALVGEDHVLVVDAGLAQSGDDLLRLGL